MTFQELKEKAQSLPLQPGVYLMQDRSGEIIYVGKAKKLRNRVSQYFVDTVTHSPKTRLMVSKIDRFDTIVAASEFEALVLECSLIKRHMPKYNILLKDDKGYPWLRLDPNAPYPALELASKPADDGAKYFGPYGGRFVSQKAIDTLRLTFKLPGCHKQFPRDIGKERPCLNFQMGNCAGWCRGTPDQAEYLARMEQVTELLKGNYRQVTQRLKEEMERASEALAFERAAEFRDRLRAIEALGQKQFVTAGRLADTDVVGFAQTASKACFAVLHFSEGNLIEKDCEFVSVTDDPAEAIGSLVKQYYLRRGAAPKEILLPLPMEDADLFAELLLRQTGKKVRIRVPQRGDAVRLKDLAEKNAREEAERITTKDERLNGTLELLQTLCGLPSFPARIESYDISNLAGADIVASMVVFENGKPRKSAYKRFKLKQMDEQDDYASMRQVLHRRFTHFQAGDAGFDAAPDLLLIDGGVAHAETVRRELESMGLSFPILGMVKDDRHRTRALVTPQGEEIGIAGKQALFALIGTIQEETHRFAITYHRKLRSSRLRRSALDQIKGVGPKRKEALLQYFKTVRAVREADLEQLCRVLPRDAAVAVYQSFHPQEDA